jgi:uncharacterized membrane protein
MNIVGNSARQTVRIGAIDFARGFALVAMAVFHFGWDLEQFGLAHPGMTLEPQWKYFARAIAASFLMLVGVSAWLAHRRQINMRIFAKRIIYVGGAALLITIATYFATPQVFIFFGILHNITLSSMLILLFMRLPASWVGLAALITLSAPWWAKTPVLDSPLWWWSGLSQITPKANDYVPIFPWFGWVLLGLALAKFLSGSQLWEKLRQAQFAGPSGTLLRFFGRHSLIFYLVHQPVMIALIYFFTKVSAVI